jgi:hypothetical protein
MVADVVVISTKVPAGLAARVEGVAATRLLSVSSLVRRALERELAACEAGEDAGPVETSARIEIERWGLTTSETRVAAALNLARRLDTDPTNGATHARELRLLLDDLTGVARVEPDPIDELQARAILRRAGWTLTPPTVAV